MDQICTRLFLDLDGVLADFDAGVKALTGRHAVELRSEELWQAVAQSPNFFGSLDFTPGGLSLWRYCEGLRPTILTGLPRGDWAGGQKRRWVAANLGAQVPLITCSTQSAKAIYSGPGHVLVDDREKARQYWEQKGGTFIRHVKAETTIGRLRFLFRQGII